MKNLLNQACRFRSKIPSHYHTLMFAVMGLVAWSVMGPASGFHTLTNRK